MALLAVCLGLFLVQLDTTAVNLALPIVHRELGGDIAALQWVMNAYLVAFAGLLLTGGTLGDRWGRRRMFGWGLAVFVVGSVGCAVADTLTLLITGRAVQGVGAALAVPQTLAIMSVTFPEPAERNRAMAAWSVVAGIALAAGPTLGGLLMDRFGWPSVFWLNVPVGIVALALSTRAIPESADPRGHPPDLGGQVLAGGFLTLLTVVVVSLHEHARDPLPIVTAAAPAVACLIAFVAIERRHPHPMLPLRLLRRGRLPVAIGVTACMTFGMYGMLLLAGMYLQRDGTGAFAAGVELLAMPLAFVVAAPLVARLTTRVHARVPMTIGMGVMGLGLLGFAAALGQTLPLVRYAAFALTGLGMALNTGPALGVAVASVAPERAGLASALANLARMVGASLGVSVLGTVFAAMAHGSTEGPAFVHGVRLALIVGATVQLAGAVIAAIGLHTKGHTSDA